MFQICTYIQYLDILQWAGEGRGGEGRAGQAVYTCTCLSPRPEQLPDRLAVIPSPAPAEPRPTGNSQGYPHRCTEPSICSQWLLHRAFEAPQVVAVCQVYMIESHCVGWLIIIHVHMYT